MIELVFKFAILLVVVMIATAIWRSRTDKLMRIRRAKNFALAGMVVIAVAKVIDIVSLVGLLNGLVSPGARAAAKAVELSLVVTGLLVALLAVWRWLEAGKKLSWIADYEIERSGQLHSRLNERGLALSTVPAIIYRATELSSDPKSMRLEFMNDKVEEILGYSRQELERTPRAFQDIMHPDDLEKHFESELASSLERDRTVLEQRYLHRDGGYRWIRRHMRRIGDTEGNPTEIIGCAFDITDLKDAEVKLQNFLDFAPDAVVTIDKHYEIVMASDRVMRIFGMTDDELIGHNVQALFGDESAHAGRSLIADEFDLSAAGKNESDHEIVCKRGDGTTFPAEINLSAIDAGNDRLVAIAVRDISDRKETEAKLHQAQKMEAVGQLTGGIAHDFNNMLTVITGNLQMIDAAQLGPRDREHAQAAIAAVDRAAELTNRLLAFSRQQHLQPKVLNVNDLIVNIEGMLRRSIGESITLETCLDRDLWSTRIDPSQLENALVNLSVNARDALQTGGRLEISTSNIVVRETSNFEHSELLPGEYVLLAVRDNGCGIAESELSRIFEPFYTSKEPGKGTGLGLSMVHGFVTQSRGSISVFSEDGIGTTISLYLPRSVDPEGDDEEALPARDSVPTGRERILVVEDNDSVREVVSNLLKSLNYFVIEASSGQGALEIMQRDEDFDLLFTDLVMPGGISGAELAVRMRQVKPGLKVLYTSGSTGTVINGNRKLTSGIILQKPYFKDALANTVRETLDG